jgi:chemotaxis protein methyltransferase CheR
MRNVPEYYREKYFRRRQDEYELAPEIRTSVRFRSLNLIEDRAGAECRNFDVIFCRNVLIYFDEKAKQKVVSFLYDSLRPGGFLFIGSSESLHNVTRAFRPVTMQKVVVYEKS